MSDVRAAAANQEEDMSTPESDQTTKTLQATLPLETLTDVNPHLPSHLSNRATYAANVPELGRVAVEMTIKSYHRLGRPADLLMVISRG